MKTLSTFYLNGLNEKIESMNKKCTIRKLMQPLPRYGERLIDTRTQCKIDNPDLSLDTNFLKSSKKKDLKLLAHQAQNSQCKDS